MRDIVASTSSVSEQTSYRAALVFSVLWFAAMEYAVAYHRPGLYTAAGVAVVVMAWSAWAWSRRKSTTIFFLATIAHVPTSLAAMSFTGGILSQQVIAVISTIFLWLIFRQRYHRHDEVRGRTMATNTAVITWCGWYALLSAGVYLNLSPIVIIVGGAALSAVAAVLVWFEAGLSFRQVRWGLLAVAWLGAELLTLTWWLPTALVVGSVIGATTITLVVQATRHLWSGEWQPGRGRRYLVAGLTICLSALISARWI